MGWNQLENNVKGLLSTAITDSDVAMSVSLLAGSKSYPGSISADTPIYLTISNASNPLDCEIVKVTAVSGANVTTMVRGQRDTSASAWAANSVVSLNLHAQDIDAFKDYISATGVYSGAVDNASVSTGAITMNASGVINADDGTALLPGITFTGDPDTGLYLKTTAQLGVTAEGSLVGYFTSMGWNGAVVGNVSGNVSGNVTGNVNGDLTGSIVLDAGTEALPSLSLTGDQNTGLWSSGADTLDFSTGGTKRLTLNTASLTSTLPFLGANGTAASPTFGFSGDSGNGQYLSAADTVSWSTGGTLRLSLSTSALTSTLPFLGANGSAASPAFGFSGDSGNGIYLSAADTLGFSTADTLRLSLSSTSLTSTLPISLPLGSSSIPAINFGTANTGIYSTGSTDIRFSLGGLSVYEFSTAKLGSTKPFYITHAGSAAAPHYQIGYSGTHGLFYNSSDGRIGLSFNSSAAIEYDAYQSYLTRSAGEYIANFTNYYEGANHNKLLLRATRGTSGTPDYLDDDDVLGRLKFEARDGDGTWGDGAEIRVVANDDHASGDTPSSIDFYSTPDSTDTQKLAARIYTAVLLPGVLNKPMATIDTRQITFDMAGGSLGFGYYGDLDANWTGVCIFDAETAHLALMLGTDGYTYLQNGSGANPFSDDSWRYGDDGSEGFTVEQYDKGGKTWEKHFRVSENGAEVNSDEAFYLGDPSTDGSWRFIRDGNNLVAQRRESSTWTTKDTITP